MRVISSRGCRRCASQYAPPHCGGGVREHQPPPHSHTSHRRTLRDTFHRCSILLSPLLTDSAPRITRYDSFAPSVLSSTVSSAFNYQSPALGPALSRRKRWKRSLLRRTQPFGPTKSNHFPAPATRFSSHPLPLKLRPQFRRSGPPFLFSMY